MDWTTLPNWALLVALITTAYTFCQVQGCRAGPGLSCSSEQTSDVWKAPGSRLYRHPDVYPSPPRRSHCAAQAKILRTHCPAHIQTRQQTNRTQGKPHEPPPSKLSHTLGRRPPPQTVDNATAAFSRPEDDTRVPGRESPVWRILGAGPVQEQKRPSLPPRVFRGKASHRSSHRWEPCPPSATGSPHCPHLNSGPNLEMLFSSCHPDGGTRGLQPKLLLPSGPHREHSNQGILACYACPAPSPSFPHFGPCCSPPSLCF